MNRTLLLAAMRDTITVHVVSSVILYCTVGITTVLALSVYQMIVNEKLPSTSDAVPLLGRTSFWTLTHVISE